MPELPSGQRLAAARSVSSGTRAARRATVTMRPTTDAAHRSTHPRRPRKATPATRATRPARRAIRPSASPASPNTSGDPTQQPLDILPGALAVLPESLAVLPESLGTLSEPLDILPEPLATVAEPVAMLPDPLGTLSPSPGPSPRKGRRRFPFLEGPLGSMSKTGGVPPTCRAARGLAPQARPGAARPSLPPVAPGRGAPVRSRGPSSRAGPCPSPRGPPHPPPQRRGASARPRPAWPLGTDRRRHGW